MTPSTRGLRRIVAATDLSARSTAWLRAAALARQTGARLTLLHVIDPRLSERVARRRANRAYVEMLSQADRTFGATAGFIDVVVRRGRVRGTIARIADETAADLIVVAAPKARRLDSIVGTTAERLVRTAKRPVLVVRREMQGNYRSVAIAVDICSASLPMLRTAASLGALDSASTTIVHAVHPSHDDMLRSVGLDGSAIDRYQLSAQEGARQRLQTMITDAGLPPERTDVIVRSDSAAAAISAVLEQQRAELLVVGASRWFLLKRLLIGNVADRLLRAAECDVLVIPYGPTLLELGVASPDALVPAREPAVRRTEQVDLACRS
jgi:universal stress protein E